MIVMDHLSAISCRHFRQAVTAIDPVLKAVKGGTCWAKPQNVRVVRQSVSRSITVTRYSGVAQSARQILCHQARRGALETQRLSRGGGAKPGSRSYGA